MIKQALTVLFFTLSATAVSFAAAPVPETAKGVPIPPEKGYHVED